MRKIHLLLLLVSGFAIGQVNLTGEAKYKLSIIGQVGFSGAVDCGTFRGLQWISSEFEDGSINNYLGTYGKNELNHYNHPIEYDNIFYTENNKIIKLHFATVNRKGNVNCSSYYNSGNPTITGCLKRVYNFTEFENIDAGDRQIPGEVIITSTPLITLPTPDVNNNLVGSDDYIVIPPISGISNQYYTWQYSTNGTTWINLPSIYQKKNLLNILVNEILNESQHESLLLLRVSTGCNNSYSNILNFSYRKSAPHATNINIGPTSCYDSNDGTANIKFDRALATGETLDIIVNDTTGVFKNFNDIVLQPNNSYVISDLPGGDYTLQLMGSYKGSNTYSPTAITPLQFTIDRPSPVDFTTSKTDVWCHGGNDGEITLTSIGGSGNYKFSLDDGVSWITFKKATENTIINLVPGTYTVKVKDGNNCIAKNQTIVSGGIQLGNEKMLSETILQPSSAVSINYTLMQQPSFYGGTNGKIVAAITGGTPFSDNSYEYQWINSAGKVQTNITTQYSGGIYSIILDGIPSDTYYLTVTDKNFNIARSKSGCTIFESEHFLNQPDPLTVTFEVQQTISCHSDNEFGNETDFNPADGQRDESQNGILKAITKGGVPFKGTENNGLPYIYSWKKQKADGTWISLNETDAIAQNLSDGNYALNIEDKNGIRLGTYVNNVLTTKIDSTYFMQQPVKLLLALEKEDVICNSGNNGWAIANVSGGTAPYTYLWTNDETTPTIKNLTAKNYFVLITDANGCRIQGAIAIEQPNGVQISETTANPTCFEGNDGSIDLSISGGIQPYSFIWNTGATSQNITNLIAGIYTVTLADAQNCLYNKSISLIAPAPVIVNLGNDRTLCDGQSHELDSTINDSNAIYQWTSSNGFISNKPKVNLTLEGTYHAKVINSLGCVGEDDIKLTTNNMVIASEFLLSSQAYLNEEVILVNISNPLGEETEWVIPNGVTIIQQTNEFIILKFTSLGTKTISLKQTQGDCYAYYSKNITVEQRSISDPDAIENPLIIEFITTPNPNNGQFTTGIKLEEIGPVKLRLFPYSGQNALIQQSGDGSAEYKFVFNSSLASGTYILVLETSKQTMVKKIILF